jgi:hypothetical protein
MKTVTQILFTTLTALLVLAGCASKPSPNLCPTVCDGLVAYYPFYGNATDKSGNGHDLSVLGPALSKDRNGYQNHSYLFDGRTTHLRFAKPLPNLGGGLLQLQYGSRSVPLQIQSGYLLIKKEPFL